MINSWLTCGVGRSGTSVVHTFLRALAKSAGQDRASLYEPYLWRGAHGTEGGHSETDIDFRKTSSINVSGLMSHLVTPLFLEGDAGSIHDGFADSIFSCETPIVKMIRGCGRLGYFLQRFENLKTVFVLRNPVDCINSQLGAFSFFGDEFHPSDSARFKAELGISEEWRCESEVSSNWWRFMNEAALKACRTNPDRAFVLPYEAIKTNPAGVSSALAKFFDIESATDAASIFEKPVGDITKKVFLRQDDLDLLHPLCKDYFENIEELSSVSLGKPTAEVFENVLARYEKIAPGSFTAPIARDFTGLRIRHHLTHDRARYAVEKNELSGALTSVQQQLKNTQKALSEQRQELNAALRQAKNTQSNLLEAKESIQLYEVEVAELLEAKRTLEKNNAALNDRISYLEWVLAPRLRSIVEMRAFRYVLKERKRIQLGRRAEENKPTGSSEQAKSQVDAAAVEREQAVYTNRPSIYDEYLVKRPLGIAVFGHTREEEFRNTLLSLDKQGAIQDVIVFIDGDQGRPQLRRAIERVEKVAESFEVKDIRRNRGNFGFRKMMLTAMRDMIADYDRMLFLEDDCFPTGAALRGFSKELDSIEKDPAVFSVYGHPFLVRAERPGHFFSRFQGWGWATTAEKLKPVWEKLLDCYLMSERDYLKFVEKHLTDEIRKQIDVTPGRNPSATIEKFFAWDETVCLLTAINGMAHLCASERIVYNCGFGASAAHFGNSVEYRKPPYNMVSPDEVWEYF
ncbi:MAG: sulfotransferase [Pseudomonadota bacterium]